MTAASTGTGGRTGVRVARWSGAVVILLIAALLGGMSVVAGYLKTQVLNTDAYVETVAPLAADPVVQDALAQRLTTEIITRSDIAGIADNVANALVEKGAPSQLNQLVGPLVGGITTFLDDKIRALLATPQFETIWQNINRAAHTAIVTVLTGSQGRVLNATGGTTITVDLGKLLSALKTQLVNAGLSFVSKVPDVSIPYTVVESDKLPKVRTYTRILNAVGTWLPYLALLIFIGGVLTAPNRRRGVLTGVVMLGVVTILFLIAMAIGRHFYINHLPPAVQSPAAALALFDAITLFLKQALQALLVALAIAFIVVLLAGPSRPAVWLRHQGVRAFDAAARGIGRTAGWTRRFGPRLAKFRFPLELALVLIGVVVFILIDRPSIGAALLLALCLLIVFAIVEIMSRIRPQPEAVAAA